MNSFYLLGHGFIKQQQKLLSFPYFKRVQSDVEIMGSIPGRDSSVSK